MNNIELKELTLTNYRNIEYATYQFDGNSMIVGENRIGKTNTLEAIMWLLTDKLLNGGTELSAIKPLSDTKKEVVVKGTFLVDGKTTVVLKKEYKEKWVKTRGTTDLVMQGHEATYYFNDVKQGRLRDYNNEVAEAFGLKDMDKYYVEVLRMLTDPFYLGNMGDTKDWTNLRSLIIKLVGDVEDSDVFNAHAELEPIKGLLKDVNGKVDQAKKKAQQTIKTLKEQLIADDAQIKLLEETEKPTEEAVAIAKKGIEEHETNIANLRNSNNSDTVSTLLEKEILEAKTKVNDLKSKALEEANKNPVRIKIASIQKEINDLVKRRSEYLSKTVSLSGDIENCDNDITLCDCNRKNLVARVKEIDKKIANIDNDVQTECPYCHRPLDPSTVEQHKTEIKERLETEKAEVIAMGKKNNSTKEEIIIEKEKLSCDKIEIEKKVEAIAKEIERLDAEMDKVYSQKTEDNSPLENPELQEAQQHVEELEEKLRKSRADFALGRQEINQSIVEEQEAMEPFKKVLADMDHYERQQKQLALVKEQKDKHAKELANNEQDKELLEMFIKVKLEMLDNNVSKVFGNIRFQLIQENINGGYDTVCKPYIYNSLLNESTAVSWKNGSKSERVITGIAIAEVIKEQLELPNLPYLFDEGGEISTDTFHSCFKTDAQLICVKVKDNISSPLVVSIDG